MLYDVLKARDDFGATKAWKAVRHGASQIPLVASLTLLAPFRACRQGISDDRFDAYFANAGELQSASCESHVYSSLTVVWRAWPGGAD
jgi:hypothetical protein